jgi:hypothetical protein
VYIGKNTMGIYILTLVIITSSGGPITSVAVEYTSKEKCEYAKNLNREQLHAWAKIALATCTPK